MTSFELTKNKLNFHYKPHPWHGIELWSKKDHSEINAFIEIVPSDTVKYEIDKETGYLKVDRPQKYSNSFPCLYGFLPKTYSFEELASYTRSRLERQDLKGDEDPLDICVLTEASISHGDIILNAIPIGGFRMLDSGEIDDKIIAVLKDDPIYGQLRSISQVAPNVINRLKHYFLTYKELPDSGSKNPCEITDIYDREEAEKIISLGHKDYMNHFSDS